MAYVLPATVDEVAVNAALLAFQTQPLDGYDLFIIGAATARNVTQIITDDGDYSTVPGIQVFTANTNALQSANSQGKLVVR